MAMPEPVRLRAPNRMARRLRGIPAGALGLWALAVASLLTGGCQQPTTAQRPVSAQGPAATQPSAATRPAMPPNALTPLDKLTPAITKPANPLNAYQVSPRAQVLVDDAEHRIKAHDFSGAIDLLERAISYEPDNAKILRTLGLAYEGLNNRGKAEENLRRCARLAPDDLELHFYLGVLAVAQKQYEQAIVSFRTATLCTGMVASNSLAAETLLRLGEVLEKQGYWTAAQECYTQLSDWIDQYGESYAQRLVLRPLILRQEKLLARRGALLVLLGRTNEGAQLLERAYQRDRTDLGCAQFLVQALIENKNYHRAEQLIIELATEPSQRMQTPALAEALYRQAHDRGLYGRIWQAVGKRKDVDESLALALAKSAEQAGAVDEAIEILKRLLLSMPDSGRTAKSLAALYLAKSQPGEAMAFFASVLAANDSVAEGVLDGMDQLATAKLPSDFDTGIIAKAQQGDSPSLFAIHYLCGRLAQQKGNRKQAAEEYQKALDLHEGFVPALDAMLDLYLAQGQRPKAQELAGKIEAGSAEPWFKDYVRGKMSLWGGELKQAVAQLQEARGLNNRHLDTYLLLQEAHTRLGQASEALADIEAAIELAPQRTDLVRRQFLLLVGKKDYRGAQDLVARLLKDQPGNVEAGLMAAELDLATNHPDKASQRIGELEKQDPQNVDVSLMSIRIGLGSGRGLLPKADFDQAVGRLNEMIAKDPQNVQLRQFLASLYNRSGLYAQAAKVWEGLAQDKAQSPEVLRQFVSSLLRAQQYEQARTVLEKALVETPEDVFLRLALLDALEKLKKYGDAERWTRQWFKEAASDSDKLRYRFRLLTQYEADKDYAAAGDLIDQWIGTDVDHSRSLGLYGKKVQLLAQGGHGNQALALARKYAGENPGLAAKQMAVSVLIEANAPGMALKLLDEWTTKKDEEDPETGESLKGLKVLVLGKTAQVDKAVAYAIQWIRQAPSAPQPRKYLVAMLAETEQYAKAQTFVDQWLGLTSVKTSTTSASAPAAASQPASHPAMPALLPAAAETSAPAATSAPTPTSRPATVPAKRPDVPLMSPWGLYAPPMSNDQEQPPSAASQKAQSPATNPETAPATESAASAPAPADKRKPSSQPASATTAPSAPAASEPAPKHKRKASSTSSSQPASAGSTQPAVAASGQAPGATSMAGAETRTAESLNMTPDFILWCRQTSVSLLIAQKKYDQALRRVEQFLDKEPTDDVLLTLKSSCLAELGRHQDALQVSEQLYRLHPNEISTNNNLGYAYADLGIKLKEAERMIKLAVASPNTPVAYVDSLGWVYYKQGRIREAAEVFEEALIGDDNQKEQPVIYDHAGDAFYRLGWTDRALEYWKHALELVPKQKLMAADEREAMSHTPSKVKAAEAGQKVDVAPLGEGVTEEPGK